MTSAAGPSSIRCFPTRKPWTWSVTCAPVPRRDARTVARRWVGGDRHCRSAWVVVGAGGEQAKCTSKEVKHRLPGHCFFVQEFDFCCMVEVRVYKIQLRQLAMLRSSSELPKACRQSGSASPSTASLGQGAARPVRTSRAISLGHSFAAPSSPSQDSTGEKNNPNHRNELFFLLLRKPNMADIWGCF